MKIKLSLNYSFALKVDDDVSDENESDSELNENGVAPVVQIEFAIGDVDQSLAGNRLS